MKNKIILILTLYTHLILLTNLNANALEDIKEKNKEIKEKLNGFIENYKLQVSGKLYS